MSPDETRAFLSQGTRTAKLATTRGDGAPHVAPIWFVLDGDEVVWTTHGSGLKAKALRRDPRASMLVDDQTPPYSFVKIDGTVTLSGDLAEVRTWATILGRRYMGADRADEYGARNGVPGELLVRLRAENVVAMRDISA